MRAWKKLACLTASLLTAAFAACVPTGGNSGAGGFMPDMLGGGGAGGQTEESGLGIENVPSDTDTETPTEEKTETSVSGSTLIDLNALEAETDCYTYDGDVLTVTAAGVYEMTGSLQGAIVVNKIEGDVRIVLSGVDVATKETQNCAAFVCKETSYNRIITVKEGTTNTFADSVGDASTDADADCAVLQAKKCALVINGTGTLNLVANGDESTGLKVKKDLDILGTTLFVNATDNGIKAGEKITLQDAKINVTATGNDGIKTDVEATTQEEADDLAANAFAGYVYIKNSDVTVVAKDDGISANAMLKIENTAENKISVTTNGGAPTTVTETSSDNADGKGIRVSGITLVDEAAGTETDVPSTTETGYMLVITGGQFEINSNDDAMASKGNLLLCGGSYNITSGDDGIHAEYLTKITDGEIVVNNCYEGIEGAQVEIYGGNIAVTSVDDGVNAANADLTNYAYNIYIGGGNLVVNANGDGVDSNGTMEFAGGTTVIYGPESGANAALDADNGILVNGGVLIALGASGMVETPSMNSEQPVIVYNMSSSCAAGSTLKITDSTGATLFETINPKKFQSAVVSVNGFVLGSGYTVSAGTQSTTATLSSMITVAGQTFGPGGSQNSPR